MVTTDTIVEGVHFLPGTPPDLIARKLLRVNLSDLAAKAAEPFGCWLNIAWPAGWGEAERAAFARGLAADQAEFGISLLGGDTVSTPGPLTASLTALGYAPAGRAVRRSGARAGDLVMVSGTIGDGWLGLQAAQGELQLDEAHLRALADRYALPEPRLALRPMLLEHASACLDVSDGLVADLGHLARASGVGIELDLEQVPLSPAAAAWAEGRGEARAELAVGGDDYELAFTVAETALAAVAAAAGRVAVTPIGRVTAGEGVATLLDGRPVRLQRTGWRHG